MKPDGMSERNRTGRTGSEIEEMAGEAAPLRPARDRSIPFGRLPSGYRGRSSGRCAPTWSAGRPMTAIRGQELTLAHRVDRRPTRIWFAGARNRLPRRSQEDDGPFGRGSRPVHLGNVGSILRVGSAYYGGLCLTGTNATAARSAV